MAPTVLMFMPFDTLSPTTKPSAKPNWVALLATSWAVLPEPLPGPISTLSPASR